MTKQERMERLIEQIDEILMEEAKVRTKLRNKLFELNKIIYESPPKP